MADFDPIVAKNDATFKPLDALRAVLDSGLDAHAKLVATVLIRHADGAGACYPSLPRIMQQASLSRREVIYTLQSLECAGLIQVERRRGLPNLYRCTGCTSACGALVQDLHGSSACGAREGCTECTGSSACGAPKLPIRTDQLTDHLTAHPVGARKRRAREETDPRVHPILQAFHEAYVKRVGKEPTKTVLDWGRDGKRIRELPADYTTDDLTAAVARFFDAPGYISRNLRFADFIAALPRLLAGEPKAGRPRRTRYVESEQQRDYSDYFERGEEA